MSPGPREPALRVRGLTVARGGRTVLRDVSFEAAAGDLVAVVGPNGAGKSTLLSAILGLLPVAAGDCEMDGVCAYVPQAEPDGRGFPVTALGVAEMGAYRRARPFLPLARRDRRLAHEALARVGLTAEARTPFADLSGGQRRRVTVARALVQQGALMLLDEPLAGVDAASEDSILQALGDERRAGRTVVMATHDLAFARDQATHALLLARGEVAAFGPGATVLTRASLARAYGPRVALLDADPGGLGALDEGSHCDHVHAQPRTWLH
jgi:manganese/zinc/iron transport system ATP- binding protein